jgi:uncharacterized protein YggE
MGLIPPPPAHWDPYVAAPPPTVAFGAQSAGDPVFVYVAVLSDAERKAALASAFARAKKDAAELAEAAGMKLGPLASLGHNEMNMFQGPYYPPSFNEDSGPSLLAQRSEFEAVSATANGLWLSIGVSVSYHLAPGG